jgi:hypothetical protein
MRMSGSKWQHLEHVAGTEEHASCDADGILTCLQALRNKSSPDDNSNVTADEEKVQ